MQPTTSNSPPTLHSNGLVRRRLLRLVCLLWPVLLLVVVLIGARLTAKLWLPGIGYWLDATSKPEPADAIAILGGNRARLAQAVQLYQQGYAPEIWHTGDAPQGEESFTASADMVRQAAIEQGIPREAIHLLPTTSTWEDGQQIAAYADERGAKRILLITSWYHGRRGLCVVRRHLQDSGIEVYYQAAYNRSFSPANWWQHEEGLMAVSGELIKLGYYWLHYGLAPWQC